MQTTNLIPDIFKDSEGNTWTLHAPEETKSYRVFPPQEDPLTLKVYHAHTNEEAAEAFSKARPAVKPPISADLILKGLADDAASLKPSTSPSAKPIPISDVVLPKNKPDTLAHLLEREQMLGQAATRAIIFSPPLISRGEASIIGRGTINVIQGAYGSHKSRLAELLASLMLANEPNSNQFLDFTRLPLERFCVCYIDTERNQNEEFPAAIQGIKKRAGFALTDQPEDFRFTSIKAIDRNQRLEAIEAFINHIRGQTPLHLLCLIDVVTDAVGDFNDSRESMRLYDFIGNLCDEHNATFLLVIHQNPGSEKARGHTGTEAGNKASAVLQIGFERDGNGNETNLIRVRYLKIRRGKRPEPVYLTFSEPAGGLIIADAETIAAQGSLRKQKADCQDICDRLTTLLSEGALPKNEVWTTLETEFKASNATIRERLKTIIGERPEMYDMEGKRVELTGYNEGRNQYFRLTPIT